MLGALVALTSLLTTLVSAQSSPLTASVPRPNGADWSLAEQHGQTLVYGRHTTQGDYHTVLAFVTLLRPDRAIADSTDLLKYVQETQADRSGASNTERHKNVDFKASPDAHLNPGCVREDGVEEDHQVPFAPDSIFIITSRAYFCFHPLSTARNPLLVELHVSQRFLRGNEPLPIEAEVEPFFRSYLQGSTLPLLRAAKAGDGAQLRALLASGSDVNMRSDVSSDWGKTALMEASIRGYADLVQALVDARADVNARDDYGETPLMFASGKGHAAIVGLLLKAGADVNAQTPSGSSALILAAKRGELAVVRLLLQAGADVKARDHGTALTLAAWNGSIPVVQALIAKGADVNAKSETGMTALMYMAAKGNVTVVRELIEKGADVNAKNLEGHTALEFAQGHPEVVVLLRKAGAKE
jgi:ankyrin repeat protein